MKTKAFLFALALAFPAAAQHQLPPGVDPSQFKPLTERKDLLSWKLLAQVDLVKMKDRYVPQFAQAIASLDQKEVKVQGFMMPLQMGDKQTHFVLSAMPHIPFTSASSNGLPKCESTRLSSSNWKATRRGPFDVPRVPSASSAF